MAQWHEFGIHAMEKQGNSSNLLSQSRQKMSQDLHNNASFSQEDIERLKQIHLAKTGKLLTTQEAIEMGIRIKNFLRIITQPIPQS